MKKYVWKSVLFTLLLSLLFVLGSCDLFTSAEDEGNDDADDDTYTGDTVESYDVGNYYVFIEEATGILNTDAVYDGGFDGTASSETVTETTAGIPEGSEAMKVTNTGTAWSAGGWVDGTSTDLSMYTNLVFYAMAEASEFDGTLKVKIEDASAAANEIDTGLTADGEWHKITIPLSSFTNPDLSDVTVPFVFVSADTDFNDVFYFDNVYFEAEPSVNLAAESYSDSATSAAITVFDMDNADSTVSITAEVDSTGDSISLDVVLDSDGSGSTVLNFGTTDDTADTILIADGDTLTVNYGEVSDTADITGINAPLQVAGVGDSGSTSDSLKINWGAWSAGAPDADENNDGWDESLSKYQVVYDTSSGTDPDTLTPMDVSVNDDGIPGFPVTVLDETAEASTTYYVFVRAVNSGGNGSWSSEASVTTPAGLTETAPSAAPAEPASVDTALFTEASASSSVTLNWASWSTAEGTALDFSGNTVKTLASGFTGYDLSPALDASGKTTLHMQVWTSGHSGIKIKLVDFEGDGYDGGNGNTEYEHTAEISSDDLDSWIQLDIPLTAWSGHMENFSDIQQLLLTGADENSTGASEYYIDNFYID